MAVLAAGLAAPATAVAQVVAIANGSPITAYDIEQRSKLIALTTHKAPPRQEVINALIDDRIKIAKAKSYGFEVPEAEVDQTFANMARAQHAPVQQFTQMIERAGIAPSTLKARIRAELTWTQLVRGKFGASLQVSEAEVNNALRERNANEADVVGHIYTLYPVMVLVPPGSSAAVVDARRHVAENLRSRFVNCNEGLAVSRALRDVAVREPVTRSSSDLAPQLREVLDSIPIGHLTTPEPTAQGLQMFALCDKRESKTDSPLKREVRQELFRQAVRGRVQQISRRNPQIRDDRIQMSAAAGLPLALTIGEPAGIGPDLTLAVWRRRVELDLPAFYLIGEPDFLRERARVLGLDVPLATVAPAQAAAAFERALPVVPLGLPITAAPGKPDASSAPAAIASIRRAVADVLAGEAAALVTNPVAKNVLYRSGFAEPGHTEFLARLAAEATGKPVHPVMMLWSPNSRWCR